MQHEIINDFQFIGQIDLFLIKFYIIQIHSMKLKISFGFLLLSFIFLGQSLHIAHMAGGQTIDTTFWYRLTTQWQGDQKSLDIINDGTNNKLQLADTGDYSGQFWKFIPVPGYPGWYKISTMFTGDKVLDVINDGAGNNQLWMTNSGFYSGQFWKLTKDNGWYRFSPMWQQNKSIDIVNDGGQNNHPWLDNTGNWSGQLWKLTTIRKI